MVRKLLLSSVGLVALAGTLFFTSAASSSPPSAGKPSLTSESRNDLALIKVAAPIVQNERSSGDQAAWEGRTDKQHLLNFGSTTTNRYVVGLGPQQQNLGIVDDSRNVRTKSNEPWSIVVRIDARPPYSFDRPASASGTRVSQTDILNNRNSEFGVVS